MTKSAKKIKESKEIRVGVIQPEIVSDNDQNKRTITTLFQEISKLSPDIAILPEKWWYYDVSTISADILKTGFDEQYNFIQNLVKEFSLPLVAGAMWNIDPKLQKPVISSFYFDSNGQEIVNQTKIHLYGREKQFFAPGNCIYVINDLKLGIKFSILICFDLTISSTLTKIVVENGAEIIFNPVLIWEEGIYNWNIYSQARALENRIPIVACNSVSSSLLRITLGQSKIIQFHPGSASPVKLDMISLSSKQEIIVKSINLSFPNEIRKARLNEKMDPSKVRILHIDS